MLPEHINSQYAWTAIPDRRENGTYGKEIKAAVKNTDTGFIIEVAFEPEVVKLADGLQIGVDYQYNDGTEFSIATTYPRLVRRDRRRLG